MNATQFKDVYKDLEAVCGKPHYNDADLNNRHFKQMFGTLQRWDVSVVKKAVSRILGEYGRTEHEAKWPKPGRINGVCEDIYQGQNLGRFEPTKSSEQRLQEAELIRIDRAIEQLPQTDRWDMTNEAAVRVLEPIVQKVAGLVKGWAAPSRNSGENNRDWAIRLGVWIGELRERADKRRLHQGPIGTFTADYLVLMCRELYEAKIIMTVREIAKERGVI